MSDEGYVTDKDDLQSRNAGADSQSVTLPVVEETLTVNKEAVTTGRVRVKKVVREHEEVVDERLLHEHVTVEHVALNKVVNEPIPVRQEGDTVVIPVLEEVFVVEKRLILKEEIRIVRHKQFVSQPQNVTLRREEVLVEHIGPDDPTTNDESNPAQNDV